MSRLLSIGFAIEKSRLGAENLRRLVAMTGSAHRGVDRQRLNEPPFIRAILARSLASAAEQGIEIAV